MLFLGPGNLLSGLFFNGNVRLVIESEKVGLRKGAKIL